MATKFDLNKPVLDGEGNPVRDMTLAKELGGLILNSVDDKVPFKLFEIGLQCMKDGILTLDTTDKDLLIKFLERNLSMTNLGKGRIWEVLNKK